MALKILFIFILILLVPYAVHPFEPRHGPHLNFDKGAHSCLVCHDGALASNVVNRVFLALGEVSRGTHTNYSYGKTNHPVGIDYRLAQIRSKGRLKDPSTFNPAVKLQNGYVSCRSCHSPDSKLRGKLVMSNAGSRLCYSCHNL